MPALLKAPTFQLPENWTPEGTACVRVVIPNSQEFFGQLIGLIDTLKWSKNFQRDSTRTGAAIVSRVWQSALESQPIQIDYDNQCEGDDMSLILRQNPDNPCQLQQSIDGGDTWLLAFDYALCLSEVIPDPSEDIPPVTPGEEFDDAWIPLIELFPDWIGVIGDHIGGDVADIALPLLDIVRVTDPGYTDTQAIEDAAETAKDLGDVSDYEEICAYRELFDRLSCCSRDSLNWIDFLNNASACLNQVLNAMSDDMINALNRIAASMSGDTMRGIFDSRTPGGGANFMSTCMWEHEIDFTAEDGGFKARIGPNGFGCDPATWQDGIGWVSAGVCGATTRQEVDIWRAFSPSSKVSIVSFDPTYATSSITESYKVEINNRNPSCDKGATTGILVWDVEDFPVCEFPSMVELYAQNAISSETYLTYVLMRGQGYNPFIDCS